MIPKAGVVVIGRNEGERLRRCLASLVQSNSPVVYVDSASTDSSIQDARDQDIHVIELDDSEPLSAARARNEGASALIDRYPDCEYVCFIDGDCELASGWIDEATGFLSSNPKVAATAGRRRERAPEASVWNRLCDLEWDTPTGTVTATGGDFVVRVSAFQEVGGFDESFVAGEEPELGLRLRRAGWEIERLDSEMTVHDAGMTRFGQWWQRCRRAGQAFLHGYLVHGDGPERFWRREALRPLLWAIALPSLILALIPVTGGWSLLLCLLFPIQAVRITLTELRRDRSLRDALLYSTACLVGHFGELSGQARFLFARIAGNRPTLVEYKRPLQSD